MLGIGLPESLLKELKLIDRAIGFIVEFIFEFQRPERIADGNGDGNEGHYPPNQSGKGGGCGVWRPG